MYWFTMVSDYDVDFLFSQQLSTLHLMRYCIYIVHNRVEVNVY